MTTPCRSALPAERAPTRPPGRSTDIRSGRDARNAGITPSAQVATSISSSVKPRTVVSIETVSNRGSPTGATSSSTRMPNAASASPARAPIAESSSDSARACRARTTLLPPSAARTACSLSRCDARTSMRLATFAHAMSRTKMPDHISATSAGFTSFTRSAAIGSTRKCIPAVSLSWKRPRRSDATASTSDCACAAVAPSRRRPTRLRIPSVRDALSQSRRSAAYMSGLRSTLCDGANSSSNPGPATPTTSARPAPRFTVRLRMLRSPP